MASFKSPLVGYENADPLPDTINPDGKSLYNTPTGVKSPAYEEFPEPIDPSNNGFDFHKSFQRYVPRRRLLRLETASDGRHTSKSQLRIYKFWENPVGGCHLNPSCNIIWLSEEYCSTCRSAPHSDVRGEHIHAASNGHPLFVAHSPSWTMLVRHSICAWLLERLWDRE
ncbi:hypothetical protein C0991_008964 [Blastosporella zonata]|nr:hypothetical protein C0991_008964 [Blastosporella zonata]